MPMDFDWVDAFTAVPFGGNGCAVVYDEGGLDPETCMTFVRETGLVECTFIGPSDVADVQFHSRIAFKVPPHVHTFVLVADEGRELRRGTPTGTLPPLPLRQPNYELARGGKFADAAEGKA